MLDAEMKRLTAKGFGTKKKKAEPLTKKQEDILWNKGLLGDQPHSTSSSQYNGVLQWVVLFSLKQEGAQGATLFTMPG